MTGYGPGAHADERTVLTGAGASAACAEDADAECGYGGTTATGTESDAASVDSGETQEGVRQIEAVSMVWTKWGLVFAYCSIFLMSFSISLESQVTLPLLAFAVSAFKTHSLLSTVYVVQGVVNAVIKPPMAKIADVFGRLEAFSICIFFFVLGYVQMALSHNVQTYASAQIFYSAGSTGMQILQQIFIADTSDLLNRSLLSSLTDTPFLITVWIGAPIASAILAVASWRWGYGIWAVILPVAFLPLALSLFLNARKAKKFGLIAKKHTGGGGHGLTAHSVKKLFQDLDIVGSLLLTAAMTLILLPLTLAKSMEGGWSNPGIVAMLMFGLVFMIAFPLWESQPKLAPHPLIPPNLLKSRTFVAGCLIGFFYFMVFYLSIQPYFYSYLLVVHNQSVSTAGRITQTFSFTASIANIVNALLIRRLARYKPLLLAGSIAYLLATLAMLRLRTLDSSVPLLVAAQAALGLGASLLHLPAQLAVQSCVATHQQVGAATAVFMTVVEVGGAVGAAISGALWSAQLPVKLEAYLPEGARGDARDIYASVVKACSYAWGSAERVAINRAYQETMTGLLTVAVLMCLPLLVLSVLVSDTRLDRVDQHVRGRVIGGEVVTPEGAESGGGDETPKGGRKWWASWGRSADVDAGEEEEQESLLRRRRSIEQF